MPVILYGVSGGYLFALAEVVDVIVFSIFFVECTLLVILIKISSKYFGIFNIKCKYSIEGARENRSLKEKR